MKIPFVDLGAQYARYREEIDAAIRTVISETSFIKGPHVDRFEADFARACGMRHCVGVANGTDAITIALKCLGIGPGDEVITVASSWISTSEAVSQTGAEPVFVDIEPDYHTLNPARIEAKITPKTKAVLPVHLYGQMADIQAIEEICKRRGLLLVEDCAQAHLASLRGRRAGTTGIASTFSFYPGKNLGAYGDAGAVVTDDDALASRIRRYANHGALKKHFHEIEGINSRLDGLQAAILAAKLPHLADWNAERRRAASWYDAALADIPGLERPKVREGAEHIFHLYVIRVEDRDRLAEHLKQRGVETAVHYPTALPFLPAYARLRHKPEDFPVAHAWQRRILSLPMYPELTREMVETVAVAIRDWALSRRSAAAA